MHEREEEMKNMGRQEMRENRGRVSGWAAVLTAMVLMLAVTACGSSLKNSKYVGKWISTSYEMSGISLDGGEDTNIVLTDNGKGVFTISGQEAKIQWKENDDGIVVKSGLTGVYKLAKKGDTLLMDQDGLKITFAKEGGSKTADTGKKAETTKAAKEKETTRAAVTSAPATTKAAETKKADGNQSFLGYWRMSAFTDDDGSKSSDFSKLSDGSDEDIKELGDFMQLEFHDKGSVYYGVMGLSEEGKWTAKGSDKADMTVFGSDYKLELHGDELYMMQEEDGKTMTYYYKKSSGTFDTSNLITLEDQNADGSYKTDDTETGSAESEADLNADMKAGSGTDSTEASGSSFDGTLQSFIPGTWVGFDPNDADRKVLLTLLIYDNDDTGNVFKGYLMTGDAQISYFCDVYVASQSVIRVTPTSDTKKTQADYKVRLDGNGKGMTWTFDSGDHTVDAETFHLEKSE